MKYLTLDKSRRLLIYLPLGLTLIGLIMIGSASVVTAFRDFGDKWYYLKLQGIWSLVGIGAFWISSKYPHRSLEKFAALFLIGTVFLLFVVLLPGIGSTYFGARRWINLGFTTIQPSEIAKLSLGIYLASLLKRKDRILQFGLMLGFIVLLIMLQPDLGTSLVITGMSLVTYFGSGGKLSYFFLLLPLALMAITLLILIAPYRVARLKSFIDPSSDPLGSSYHIRQAVLAIGSGGVGGVGLGQSKQKYDFLPEATTDSIFAVVSEELGLLGSAALLIIFLILTLAALQISQAAVHPFSSNLALALSGSLGLQAFLNISAITALFPLTGIPLNFISYGGSALVINLMSCGILLNIARSINAQR